MLKQTNQNLVWNIQGVVENTTLSKSTIYRLIAAGSFPAGRKISSRRVVWDSATVLAFLAGGAQ